VAAPPLPPPFPTLGALLQRRASMAAQAAPPQAEPLDARIGFIGAGQMGEALIRGFIKSGVSTAGRISASVATFERRELLSAMGINNVFDAAADGGAAGIAGASDVIVLGVKPQAMGPVLRALGPHVGPRHLIISIAAGIRIETLEVAMGAGSRIVRVMPNTPCLVQAGASAYALGANATPQDADLVHALLSSVGLAIQVEEKMMDAVTGLSGSGPAFVFMMIEALADGGVAAGLPRDTALALAAQTVAGAAQMVFQGDDDDSAILGMVHPGILKDRVASPAGTTIAGICELETSGVRGAYIRAVKAAAARSGELG
jgi:pyrroline-5-carboxylate reductase